MHSGGFPSSSGNAFEVNPSDIFVDAEGDWYYKGNPIVREDIIELFLKSLRLNAEGIFSIEWGGQKCPLRVVDTPFVVSRADRVTGGSGDEQVSLKLRHLSDPEVLDARTLRVGKENVLYCRVRGGRFPARFSRPAYYQIAEWIDQDQASGEFYLELNADRYPVLSSGPC